MVKVWELASGRDVVSLEGHEGPVAGLSFSPDGKHLAGLGPNRTVKVWETTTGRETLSLKGYRVARFSPDGQLLACGRLEFDQELALPGEITFWDLGARQEVLSLKGHALPITCLAFSPNGKRLASGSGWSSSKGAEVKVWDRATGQELLSLGHVHAGATAVAFSPDGSRLAATGLDGTITVWDGTRGR